MGPCSYERLAEAEAEINRLEMDATPQTEPEYEDPLVVLRSSVEEAIELLREDHESANHWGLCPSCRALALLEAL